MEGGEGARLWRDRSRSSIDAAVVNSYPRRGARGCCRFVRYLSLRSADEVLRTSPPCWLRLVLKEINPESHQLRNSHVDPLNSSVGIAANFSAYGVLCIQYLQNAILPPRDGGFDRRHVPSASR